MKLRIAVIHFAFALTGIVTTMLGPILPLLIARWSLNDAQAGRLFAAQFVSSVMGSLVASRALTRWGTSRTMLVGLFIVALGVAGVSAQSLPLGIAAICTFGIGLGFALPATNLLVAELVPDRRAAALNLLNFSWTVGAVAAPIALAAMLKPVGLRGSLWILSAMIFAAAVAASVGMPPHDVRQTALRCGFLPASARLWFAIIADLLLLLYVGVENGFCGWVPSFSLRSQNTSATGTALIQGSFWGAILLGRLMAPLVLRRISAAMVVQGGLVLAAFGIVLTSASANVPMLEVGVIVCGLGLSAVFPTAVAIFTEAYGTGGTGSIVLGTCGIGGAIVPWMVGWVSNFSNSLRLGFLVTLVCTAAALIMFWRLRTIERNAAPATNAVAAR